MVATSGAEIVAREQLWGGLNTVLYSQVSTNSPTGHRCDCSGFVSMCLGLPTPGPSTIGLPAHLNRINWEDLQPGDIIGRLGPGTGGNAGHVQVFNRRAGGLYEVCEQGGGWGPDLNRYSLQTLKLRGYLPYRSKYINGGVDEMSMLCKRGDTGPVVEALQVLILKAGGALPEFGVDGDYGQETANALVALQVTGGDTSGNTYGPTEYGTLFVRVAQKVAPPLGNHHHTTGSPQTS